MSASMIPVSGTTALYVHVGDPISQVRSPQVMNALFAQAGIDALMIPLHVPRDQFLETMHSLMQIRNLHGVVLTVPFKIEAMALVREILPGGRVCGAINAMRRTEKGIWQGEMFDGEGFVAALTHAGHEVSGRRALLVGTGGAGRAIAMSLARHGLAQLDLCDTDRSRAEAVAEIVMREVPSCRCAIAPAVFAGQDIAINATPLGMQPSDELPFDPRAMTASSVLFDIVPRPEVTPLMHAAQKLGVSTIGGRKMVEGQARAIARFFGNNV
jgi:shikimate dehydrogenase